IGIKDMPTHTFIPPNHPSARKNPEIVNEYVASEVAGECYFQAFSPSELEAIIGPFHMSPL
ncbi:hypothetical protein BDQ17DRAFT_1185438, partial [Cyathus striatus]